MIRPASKHPCPATPDDGGRAAGWLTATFLYWAALVCLMHLPGDRIPEALHPEEGRDSAAHAGAFAVFAVLICRTLDAFHGRRHGGANAPLGAHSLVFFVLVIYGYADEQTQPWSGRTADDADWAADIIGAGLGVAGHVLIEILLGGRKSSAPRRGATTDELVATVRSVEVELSKGGRKRRRSKHRRKRGGGRE